MAISLEGSKSLGIRSGEFASSYLEWGPILGGAVLAAAISSIMTAFGSAIGLSLVSADPGRSTSLIVLAIAAALWAVWISVSAFAAGGYLAGRMRKPIGDSSPHESDVRDGTHGLVVWATASLLLTLVTASTITGATKTAIVSSVGAASMMTVGENSDPFALALDRLGRSDKAAGLDTGTRQEFSRIFVSAVSTGSLSDDDRRYVANKIAAIDGIPQAEANQRVDDAMTSLTQAKNKALQAAERARKVGIVTAFLTAAVLAVGAAAAWGAALVGGKHRDDGIDLSHLIRARRRARI